MVVIIDATDHIMGRLSSNVAKRLLDDAGSEIAIVNSEKAIVTGPKKRVFDDFLSKRRLNHPRKGPNFPRMPDRILKRTIRGMLPYQQPRGREALKRVKVYIGIPSELKGKKMEVYENAKNENITQCVTLGEVSKVLGARF